MVTIGMFDGFHVGHRQLVGNLLQLADKTGLEPMVVTFDRHPRSVVDKDRVPQLLSTDAERMALIEGSGVPRVTVVHFTPELASMSACSFARQLHARLAMKGLLLGYDNQFGSRLHNDFDQLPALAQSLHFAIYRDTAVIMHDVEVSSTKIRHALAEGRLKQANDMLARPYSITGTVVHGRHVGSTLGFPTANVRLDGGKVLPLAGVYAAVATLDGRSYKAMANLGPQPTFGQEQMALEVHLLDFEGDIYGRQLQVAFVARLRDICHFDSTEVLMNQLEHDKKRIVDLNM